MLIAHSFFSFQKLNSAYCGRNTSHRHKKSRKSLAFFNGVWNNVEAFKKVVATSFGSFGNSAFYCRNWIKNPEKVFRFWDKSVWSCCRIFCILQQEYLSSAVNVLANCLKISAQSKAVFFQLNLPEIHTEKG